MSVHIREYTHAVIAHVLIYCTCVRFVLLDVLPCDELVGLLLMQQKRWTSEVLYSVCKASECPRLLDEDV